MLPLQGREMRIICTGNPEFGVASAIAERWPETTFVSRTDWGYDLTQNGYKDKLAEKALNYDVFINCSALWQYHQTLLLDVVYKNALKNLKRLHIVSLGSTTDRATKGSDWHYQQEKKALRSTSNALGLKSIWAGGPKVSYVTFGTLENNAHKHPGRAVMQLNDAVDMIEYVVNMPYHLNVNELSIDPIQTDWPNE
jgi:NADP-dependent 3-hydroxy acid dehydrogenase YdfG